MKFKHTFITNSSVHCESSQLISGKNMVRIKESDLDAALDYSLLRGDMNKIWNIHRDEKNMNLAMGSDLVKREKDRAIRAQLNSANGDTAEIHDQFYRDHKLLLVLFRALAVMPITRSSPGFYLKQISIPPSL